jgi:DNA-binding GntR family transcriptional regulator
MKARNKNQKGKSKLSAEQVYHLLKEKLTSLEFKPGQSLTEKEIASHFKVSRTPVRHALSNLERDGLVEIIPRKGAFIKFLSMKDIIEIFQVREALEGLAARLAAENVDLEALKKFETFYVGALQKNSSKDLQEIFNFGMKFHDFIIDSAANQRIKKILKDLRVQFEISRIFFLNQNSSVRPSRAVQSIREHLRVIEALRRRDGDLAEARLKEHISNAKKYTFSFQGILGEGF